MKLYYSTGACSLAPHIVSREAGIPIELKKVKTKDKTMEGGGDFHKVNAKGYVPALQLDDGQILTECAVIIQYLADLKPESNLAPSAGSIERYRLQEWLNFIATDIHKGFSPLFTPNTPDEYKKTARDSLAANFGWLERQLEGRNYLMGEGFTVADTYLFTVVNWTNHVQIDLAPWPNLAAFQKRVAARPKVREALRAEGLLREAENAV